MKIYFDLDGPILDVSERYYEVYKNSLPKGSKVLNKKTYWNLKRAAVPEEIIFSKRALIVDTSSR
ncbi:MAG: hypothetical protein IIA50_01265 [Bacteroidetes bacterium]|nr:hypothetical protein [Bacteroidota bacterium]